MQWRRGRLKRSNVTLYSDSQVSIKKLGSHAVKEELTWECWRELQALSEGRDVTLHWVRGHAGTEGNEEADKLAKEATEERIVGPEPALPIPRSRVMREIKEKENEWSQGQWKHIPGCRQSKENMRWLKDGDKEYLLSLSRIDLRQMVALLTGHCTLNRHLHLLKIAETAKCPKCDREEETPDHFLGRCPAFAMRRLANLSRVTLEPGEWRTFSLSRILRYVKETKRFQERVDGEEPGK